MSNAQKKRNEVALEGLRKKMDEYMEKYTSGCSYLKKLDTQLTFLKAEIAQNRSKLKFKSTISAKVFYGHNAVKENLKNTQSLLIQLEKRHHGMLLRSSEYDIANKKRRGKINKTRHKQTVCKAIHAKLTHKFHDLQRDLADAFTRSSQIMGEKKLVEDKIRALRETEKLEIEAYEEEMESLAKYIKQQNQITEHLKNVGTRILTSKKKDFLSKEEEERLRHEMHHHESDKTYAPPTALDYEIAFNKLMKECGSSNLNEFIRLYVKRFDESFNLYSFVQRLKSDVFAARNELDHKRAQLQKYIDSEGELHKKQLSVLSTVKAQKQSLVSGIRKTSAALDTNTRRVNDWCAQVQNMVSFYLGHESLMRIESRCLHALTSIVLDYEVRHSQKWKVPETKSSRRPEIDDENANGVERKYRAKSVKSPTAKNQRLKKNAKSPRHGVGTKGDGGGNQGSSSESSPRGTSTVRRHVEAAASESPQLITSLNLEKALSCVEELCLSVLKRVATRVSSGNVKDVVSVPLHGFIGPRSQAKQNSIAAAVSLSSLPTSTEDPEDDSDDDDYDVKLVNLSACRKEFEKSMTSKAHKQKRARKRTTKIFGGITCSTKDGSGIRPGSQRKRSGVKYPLDGRKK
eukprot:g3493.t1